MKILNNSRDESRERTILSEMITTTAVIAKIAPLWDGELFSNKYANITGGWCVDYYKRHREAPKRGVEAYYHDWTETTRDKSTVKIVEAFLTSLSEEYEVSSTNNPDHILDVAGKHFNKVKATKLKDKLTEALETGKLLKAEALIANYQKVEIGAGAGVDLFVDKEAVYSSFMVDDNAVIIDYGKRTEELGQIFGDAFERDGFVTFCGSQKSGKSFWLNDVAFTAMTQRKRVAYFQIGDMSRRQLENRLLTKAARHPIRSTNGGRATRWPCDVKIPISIKLKSGERFNPVLKHEIKSFSKPLDAERGWRACERIMKLKTRSKRSFFRMSCHSMLSINVLGIKSIIETWINDGWVPDVVVVDYADNIAPMEAKDDKRHQINTTWSLLRQISQEFHNCVVTATQMNVKSYNADWIDRTNFAEDNRKWNHVTAAFGINSKNEEKEKGVSRINRFLRREEEANARCGPSCAECLPLGNPCVVATW